MTNKKVAVVGAGISGVCAAYYLARAGYQVTVYDAERYPAMRTSFANGGQVSVSNSEVWTTWSNVFKGIKWMFRKDAPLLIKPSFEWARIKWMSKFLWTTMQGSADANTAETIRMGLEARALYKDIIAEESLEFDQTNSGILHFYKNPEYLQNAHNVKELYNANGCSWDMLGEMQTKSMDPALAQISGIVGGAWTGEDWTGDIHKFCTELCKVLETKYGVEFKFNTEIKDGYELALYDNVVVSNGVGSTALAKLIGDSIDVYPVKGYSITINVSDEDMKYVPKVSLLDDEAKIVTSTLGNRFRVAGTAELAGEDYDIRRDRIDPLLNWVHTNFPNINTSDYTQWACLRPMAPDMMPIIKQSKVDSRVFYHTGHGHLGWTLSPATAKRLVNLIKE
jgi:D-amino-acid dehydrogenase